MSLSCFKLQMKLAWNFQIQFPKSGNLSLVRLLSLERQSLKKAAGTRMLQEAWADSCERIILGRICIGQRFLWKSQEKSKWYGGKVDAILAASWVAPRLFPSKQCLGGRHAWRRQLFGQQVGQSLWKLWGTHWKYVSFGFAWWWSACARQNESKHFGILDSEFSWIKEIQSAENTHLCFRCQNDRMANGRKISQVMLWNFHCLAWLKANSPGPGMMAPNGWNLIKTVKSVLAMPCLEKQLLSKSALIGTGIANISMPRSGMERKACAGFARPSRKIGGRWPHALPGKSKSRAWTRLNTFTFWLTEKRKRIHYSFCQVSAMTLWCLIECMSLMKAQVLWQLGKFWRSCFPCILEPMWMKGCPSCGSTSKFLMRSSTGHRTRGWRN